MIRPEPERYPLTPEQWRLAEELGRLLQPAQALWLGGYFTGIGAGSPLPLSQPAPSNGAGGRTLTILYGTETGNSAELSQQLKTAAEARGLSCTVADMADYKFRQLGQEQDLLIIVSTYGEGDPPQPATGFFDFVEGRKAPRLHGLRFAVLALGDSTYEFYCHAGKRLDEGRLAPRVDCDVDYEEQAANWIADVVAQLSGADGRPASSRAAAICAPSGTSAQFGAALHDKRNPYPATIIENIPIVGRGSSKETRHVEVSLAGSGIGYEPGDALWIAAFNDPDVVSSLLEALALAPDAVFELKGSEQTLAEALTHRFEITAATPRFLEYWAVLSQSETLRQLLHEDRAGERSVFLRTHHVTDIVRRFPVADVMPRGFVSALRPLQPRLYSLASSLSAAPEEAHLTIAPVRYVLHGTPRSGVASGLLADRAHADSMLPVYVQSNPHFRLPQDDVPGVPPGARGAQRPRP
jgi:sulfite reductase (NADPH) flavoprotein alpha-component